MSRGHLHQDFSGGSAPPGRIIRARTALTSGSASRPSSGALSTGSSFSCLRLVVVTIADLFPSVGRSAGPVIVGRTPRSDGSWLRPRGAVALCSLAGDQAADRRRRPGSRALYSGHSLRSGFLTSAAEAGASLFKLTEVSRHKSLDTLRGYVRRVDLFKEHAVTRKYAHHRYRTSFPGPGPRRDRCVTFGCCRCFC
jgi:hypothetical protein